MVAGGGGMRGCQGGCMVARGMHCGWGACMVDRGVYVVAGGHVWLLGVRGEGW